MAMAQTASALLERDLDPYIDRKERLTQSGFTNLKSGSGSWRSRLSAWLHWTLGLGTQGVDNMARALEV
jgi:hypothetical protein